MRYVHLGKHAEERGLSRLDRPAPANLLSFVRTKWDLLLFFVGILGLSFAVGMAVERFRIFPYYLIDGAAAAAEDWRENWRHYLQIRSKHLRPSDRKQAGVTRYEPTAAWAGATFLTLYRDDQFGAVLIDMEGRILHTWKIAFSEAFPDASHLEVAPPDFDVVLHGAKLLPSGDVILNMEGVGAVRINRDSRVVWRLPMTTHHSLQYLPNGETLIGADRTHRAPVPRFPRLVPGPEGYFKENLILRVQPDGSVSEEISILDVIHDSGWTALISGGEEWLVRTEEPTHVNDIEILSEEIAAAFPLFQAGDLMLSLRNNNTILVVDGQTRRIKWAMTGPFLFQHDPDFIPNGNILVFDNRRTGGTPRLGYSRVLEIDPNTRQIVWSYEGTDAEPFYTDIRGMQQLLPNGNVLVVEAQRGRVFEVARGSDNRIVWEYVNVVQEGFVGLVTAAERVSLEQLTFLSAVGE
jgi:hypothetical protein